MTLSKLQPVNILTIYFLPDVQSSHFPQGFFHQNSVHISNHPYMNYYKQYMQI